MSERHTAPTVPAVWGAVRRHAPPLARVRVHLGLLLLVACRPRAQVLEPAQVGTSEEPTQARSDPVPDAATASAPTPIPAMPRPPSRKLGETLVAGPLVEATPANPCPPGRECAVERVPAAFQVRFRLDREGPELRPLLDRLSQRTDAIEACMNAGLRRDRCVRHGVALLYRLPAAGAPEWIAIDGGADDLALTCVDREVRDLGLRRWVPPEAGAIELLVLASYRPAHRAYVRTDGVGLAASRVADDPPCPSP